MWAYLSFHQTLQPWNKTQSWNFVFQVELKLYSILLALDHFSICLVQGIWDELATHLLGIKFICWVEEIGLCIQWSPLVFSIREPIIYIYIYITPTLYTSTFRGCFVSSLLVLDCSFQGGFEGVLIDVVLTHDKF